MPKLSRETKQKKQIKEAAMEFTGFFSAEDLHLKAKKINKTIGIATIYRSLKGLEINGDVHRYLCGKRKLYSTKKRNHCHFICHRCGKTEHFEMKNIDFIREGEIGHACHFQVDVHGICRGCLEKDRPQAE